MRSPKLKIKKELKILIFGLIIGVVGISGAISYKIYADSKKRQQISHLRRIWMWGKRFSARMKRKR